MGMFDSITNAVSDAVGGVGDAITGNAGLIGQGVGYYFGGPMGAQIGGTIGGAIQGGPSGGKMVQSGLQGYGGMLQSQASQNAARQAAQGAQFRPVGITNTFGSSNFGYDPTTGQLTSAGYTLSPYLQQAQKSFMEGLPQNLQDTANIQAMGRKYMAQSPQEQAQQYIANQKALLAPLREQQSAQLLNQLSNTGRTGLSIAQGGNLGMANPEFQALANARAMQDLQLAANATQAGQQQYQFGQGLLSSAYQPYNAALTTAGATEALGQQPLELSSSLGRLSAATGANAGKYITSPEYSYNAKGDFLGSAGGSQLLGQGISSLFGNRGVPSWATGSDVFPTSTFTGGGSSLLDPELAALIGL